MIYHAPIHEGWRRQWHPTPVLLPGKSHGRRSLVGCSPWGHQESDTTERLHFDFSLSCIEEENGNPLQYSCLENPRDRGAWWAAFYGVPQSQTRLKRLSSNSCYILNESSEVPVEKEVAWPSVTTIWIVCKMDFVLEELQTRLHRWILENMCVCNRY